MARSSTCRCAIWSNSQGRRLFVANWTSQEGVGRPLTKGTGSPLSDPQNSLVFPRNFNRVSAPDANSCAGCHNAPFGVAGGGGDIVTNVFVLGQRFDFATMNTLSDGFLTKGTSDERGLPADLQNVANSRMRQESVHSWAFVLGA